MSSARAYYAVPVQDFLDEHIDSIVGAITKHHSQDILHLQSNAWRTQIGLLKSQLTDASGGHIFFEFVIPRMGRRADAVLSLDGIIFVIEFKTGAVEFAQHDIRQAEGYALDLKNFHSASHHLPIVPILVATHSKPAHVHIACSSDDVYLPILTNGSNLRQIIESVRGRGSSLKTNALDWVNAPYRPTPTIVEAAQALYAQHSVYDIARNDAGAQNLSVTSQVLKDVITRSRHDKRKSICFVTGVPGAGKTLVGLNIATSSPPSENALFLSGNGPQSRSYEKHLLKTNMLATQRSIEPIREGKSRVLCRTSITSVTMRWRLQRRLRSAL